ncbi:MAG: Sugar or sugar phosphate isomerase/epimerase/dehydrotase [uncultured Rubrobacteraceae bacterium]|uniref:Sugar or sugar phosphate isomerase/epimerase/dehydrotase n=1 Tax=uncultured Rubrobacteraceae bacterium TaxID=349277 RepID=A0A6J4QP52_9ACTN|nr:MAG: Sugar or sugar phosphate isomerase/epimerase/dehydrotase [uncultured Rubrobacteraceae bacterium]
MRADQISLQLYTVREHTATDMPGTLLRLAEIGYTAVETAGFGGLAPRELRRVLDDLGLRASGAHVPLDTWESDPGSVVADMHAIGSSHAVIPMTPPGRRGDEDSVARLAENFNRWGGICRAEGLTFSYHNHDFEFARLGDTTMWEVLVRETDPDLVHLELDLYWIKYGGADPETVLRDVGGRVSLVHLKDMAPDETLSDLPVGEGTMPWTDLLNAAGEVGAEWYVVEQDNPRDAMEDVETSLRKLQELADG